MPITSVDQTTNMSFGTLGYYYCDTRIASFSFRNAASGK